MSIERGSSSADAYLDADDMAQRGTAARRVNWRWVIPPTVIGAGLIVVALTTESRWAWRGVVPDLLVNSGTVFLLAAFLYHLQRHFTSTVLLRDESIRRDIEQSEARFEERVETRLADLQNRIDTSLQERATQQDATIATLAENVTFETVAAAIGEANRLGAIAFGAVTVPASRDVRGAAVTFRCGWPLDADYEPDGDLRVEVEVRIEALLARRGGRPHVGVEWGRSDAADSVGQTIIEQIQRAGEWHGAGTFDWTFALDNLRKALMIAVASQRSDRYAWRLGGSLAELVGDVWAVTEAGIESHADGLIVSEASFPERSQRGAREETWTPPDRPASTPPDVWERLLELGKRRFPSWMTPTVGALVWRDYTGDSLQMATSHSRPDE